MLRKIQNELIICQSVTSVKYRAAKFSAFKVGFLKLPLYKYFQLFKQKELKVV